MTDLVLIAGLSFICQFINTLFGMGFGTILTPLLLLSGYAPLQIVPAILCADFVTGIMAVYYHQRYRNIRLQKGSPYITLAIRLSILAFFAMVLATYVATHISVFQLKLWIGITVTIVGFITLFFNRIAQGRSFSLFYGFGFLAAFNKGISGGGYGPLIMSGHILNGIRAKTAIGITSMTESVTCLFGILFYGFQSGISWGLSPVIVGASVCAVPCASRLLKYMPEKRMKPLVGKMFIAIGLLTIWKSFSLR